MTWILKAYLIIAGNKKIDIKYYYEMFNSSFKNYSKENLMSLKTICISK